MEVVLNEKKFAENLIKSKSVDRPLLALNLVSRYYRQIEGLSGKELYNAVDTFMEESYLGYNTARWSKTVDSFLKSSNKYKLTEIEYIPITLNELYKISEIENIREERLLFSLLCFAKLYNAKNEKNNGWVNANIRDICRSARVSVPVNDREHYLYELIQLKLIKVSSKSGNDNLKVLFIDNNSDSEVVLKITDFKELGYEYLNWKRGALFICKKCGRIYNQNKSCTRLYCKECSKYQPMETKTIVCKDCGKEFEVDSKANNQKRCPECYKIERKRINRQNYLKNSDQSI